MAIYYEIRDYFDRIGFPERVLNNLSDDEKMIIYENLVNLPDEDAEIFARNAFYFFTTREAYSSSSAWSADRNLYDVLNDEAEHICSEGLLGDVDDHDSEFGKIWEVAYKIFQDLLENNGWISDDGMYYYIDRHTANEWYRSCGISEDEIPPEDDEF